MHSIELSAFDECIVVHFGGPLGRINAYTLATTLVNIADAAKIANATINPGWDIEVVVEAFGSGSFRASLKPVYRGLQNIFQSQELRSIVLSVIAAFIYQHTLSPDTEVVVNVSEDMVEIIQGDKHVIIPKEVHNCVSQLENSEQFRRKIQNTFSCVEEDESVESLGFTPRATDEIPAIDIPRSSFPLVTDNGVVEANSRSVTEIATVNISRAILERSRRKWEFVWRGVKISAPVLDQQFYDDFFAHRVTIAPGDILEVELKILQERNLDNGIFTNRKYEVIAVRRHIPRPPQSRISI
jgi:hypothetical protein